MLFEEYQLDMTTLPIQMRHIKRENETRYYKLLHVLTDDGGIDCDEK